MFHGIAPAADERGSAPRATEVARTPEPQGRDVVGVAALPPLGKARDGAASGAQYRVPLTDDEWHAALAALTVVPDAPTLGDAPPEPVVFAQRDASGVACVPRFYGLAAYGSAAACGLREGLPLATGCHFTGRLVERTKQPAVVDAIGQCWRSSDPRLHGVRVVLPCGFGKTVVAIAAVAAHGRRACVVVPNGILADQWCERFATFLPQAHVRALRGSPASCKDACWFAPGRAAADVAAALGLRERTVKFSAADVARGRKVTLRCVELLEATSLSPASAAVERTGERAFTLSQRGDSPCAVEVRVRERIKPACAELRDVPGGCAVRLAKARSGAQLAAALGEVVPSVLATGAVPAEWATSCDVVVTTVQTLAMAPPHESALAGFGVLVADEVHSMCARVFSTALQRVPARRVLALSATPERRDGMHVALPWLCGVEVARLHRTWERVDVELCEYGDGARRERRMRCGQLNLAQMITDLASDARRTERIARRTAALAEQGREVLVLSERVEHLGALRDAIAALTRRPCGVLCGATSQSDRDAAARRPILLATYPMCRQGFDKARLDTLVMATPVTSIEQCAGRILRAHPDKATPLIVDVVDPFSIFMGEKGKRVRQYGAWKYTVRASVL